MKKRFSAATWETRPPALHRSLRIICALAAVVFLVNLACSFTGSSPRPAQPASHAPAATPILSEESSGPAATPLPLAATEMPVATPTSEPASSVQASSLLGAPDPSASSQPLAILDQWFGMDPTWASMGMVHVALVVKNPNQDWGFSRAEFVVTFYDKAGNHLVQPGTVSLGPFFPGQTIAFHKTYNLPENTEVEKVEIQLQESVPNKPGKQGFPLSADRVSLVKLGDDFAVTGIIKNALGSDIFLYDAEALGYDANGKLISAGGGISLSFVPMNGQVGVQVRLSGKDKPARVELIPSFLPYSEIEPPSDEMKDIKISEFGVRLGGANQAKYAVIFANQNPNRVYLSIDYNFTAYAEDGHVLAATSSDTRTLFPNGQVAVSGSTTLPADAKVDKVEILFNYAEETDLADPNNKALSLKANPLTASQDVIITGEDDNYYYHFSGTISNSLDEALDYVDVVAVAYDDQGKIIGSGTGSVNLPANGSASVKIDMDKTSVKPARVVLFPLLPGNWGS